MVVGMSLYSQIREAYIAGESQRSIAKRLGVDSANANRESICSEKINKIKCPFLWVSIV